MGLMDFMDLTAKTTVYPSIKPLQVEGCIQNEMDGKKHLT